MMDQDHEHSSRRYQESDHGRPPASIQGVAVFAAAALVGPLIRLLSWPPGSLEASGSARAEDLLYEILGYLWPTQPLAVFAPADSVVVGFIFASLANIALFAVVGRITDAVSRRRHGVPVWYSAYCALLLAFGLFESGAKLKYFSVSAFGASIVFYGLVFLLSTRRMAPYR